MSGHGVGGSGRVAGRLSGEVGAGGAPGQGAGDRHPLSPSAIPLPRLPTYGMAMATIIRIREVGAEIEVVPAVYDPAVVEHLRTIPGRRWSAPGRAWLIPRTAQGLDTILSLPGVKIDLDPALVHLVRRPYDPVAPREDATLQLLRRVSEELRLLRYSPRTRKLYLGHLRRFLERHPAAAHDLTAGTVRRHLLELEAENRSTSYLNQALSAIRFAAKLLGATVQIESVGRPKRPRHLPSVLSPQDVRRILKAPRHPRHRLALTLAYSAGLRVGELVRLRVGDVDSDRRLIHVHEGKGRKDRYTLLAETTARALYPFLDGADANDYIFPGARTGRHLTVRSIQKVFERALRDSGVQKHATIHTLRHSFATHLLENGVSVRHIQELLGHSSPKTTEIYTHIAQSDLRRITNPLDAPLD